MQSALQEAFRLFWKNIKLMKSQEKSRSRRGQKPKDKNASCWLWGTHAVHAALANPERKIERVLATRNGMRELTWAGETEEVSPKTITSTLPDGAVHQGIAAKVQPLPDPLMKDFLATLAPDEPAFLVFTDQVTDPHNMGAIMRSCAAFGANALIGTWRHSPPVTGVFAKSASGAVEHVTYMRATNLARAMEEAKEAGFYLVGLAGEMEATIKEAPSYDRLALVLGAEGSGLRQKTRETCNQLVQIPMNEEIGSLNVSNAAAVAMWELVGR